MIKPPKPIKCRMCKAEFLRQRPMQKVCSPLCARKQADVIAAVVKKNLDRADTAERKAKLKTRSQWMAEAQSVRNALVRERDRNDGCISCDKPASWNGQWHASHYLSVGSHPALRFDLANIHKSCSVCNNYLSGNQLAYRPRLIVKEGQAEVDRLEGPHEPLKITIDELKAQIKQDRAEIRRLKAMR